MESTIVYALLYAVGLCCAQTNYTVLSVLHINDIHCHLDHDKEEEPAGTDKEEAYQLEQMRVLARIINWSKNLDSKEKLDTLVINTGSFTGAPWVGDMKKETVELLSKMRIDFSSFGHFGFGYNDTTGTAKFLDRLNFPVLCSNLEETSITGLVPTYRVKINGGKHELGLIGYFSPHETSDDVKFGKVATTLKKVSDEMKDAGVKTIIAVGHLGKEKESMVGLNVKNVDVFIGSHIVKLTGEGETLAEKRYPYRKLDEDKEKRYTYFSITASKKYMFVSKFVLDLDPETGGIIKAVGIPIPDNVEELIQEQIQDRQAMLDDSRSDDVSKNTTKTKTYRSEAIQSRPVLILLLPVWFRL